jgi:hypothetical protein
VERESMAHPFHQTFWGGKVTIMSEKALLKLFFFSSFFSTHCFPHNFSTKTTSF